MSRSLQLAVVTALAMVSAAASAAPVAIDTTDAVAQVTAAGTGISAVGVAIIALAALSLGYRWVKATFF